MKSSHVHVIVCVCVCVCLTSSSSSLLSEDLEASGFAAFFCNVRQCVRENDCTLAEPPRAHIFDGCSSSRRRAMYACTCDMHECSALFKGKESVVPWSSSFSLQRRTRQHTLPTQTSLSGCSCHLKKTTHILTRTHIPHVQNTNRTLP